MGIPARDILDADMARWSAVVGAARRLLRQWKEKAGGAGSGRHEQPYPGRPGVVRERWTE